MYVLFAFFAIGLLDRAFGFRFGLGREIVKGMDLMGLFTLSIVGMICLSPVLADLLTPIVTPFYTAIGADPAMFAPNFVSVDSGGYSLAVAMAQDPVVGRWAGTCVGSLLGAVISFNIPVMFSMIGKEHYRIFSVGALSALITAPVGCIAGGFVCGVPVGVMLRNLLPVLVVALAIALGLLLIPDIAIKAFVLFSKFLTLLISVGLGLAVLERMTGIVLVKGMLPLRDGLLMSGTIAITCAGAICMVYVILRIAGRPIRAVSGKIGLNEVALINTLIGFSTIAPGGAVYREMNRRGKIVFGTVSCTIANVLGGHMGFIAAQDPEMLPTLFVCKIVSAAVAIPLALAFARRLIPQEEELASEQI